MVWRKGAKVIDIMAVPLQVNNLIDKWSAAQSQLEESEESGEMSKDDWLKQQIARSVDRLSAEDCTNVAEA